MNSWTAFWLILAAVLGVIEISSVNLITIWFAVSALVVALIAALGASIAAQITVFIIVSAILVLATRPLARRFLEKKTVATNADRIIAAEGIVIEEIDAIKCSGQVRVMGQIWSAKSKDGQTLSEGMKVRVEALEGVKVVVSAVD